MLGIPAEANKLLKLAYIILEQTRPETDDLLYRLRGLILDLTNEEHATISHYRNDQWFCESCKSWNTLTQIDLETNNPQCQFCYSLFVSFKTAFKQTIKDYQKIMNYKFTLKGSRDGYKKT